MVSENTISRSLQVSSDVSLINKDYSNQLCKPTLNVVVVSVKLAHLKTVMSVG